MRNIWFVGVTLVVTRSLTGKNKAVEAPVDPKPILPTPPKFAILKIANNESRIAIN